MNNIDPKSFIANGNQFNKSTKNDLSKSLVPNFDQKETSMDLNKDSEKESKRKRKEKKILEFKKNVPTKIENNSKEDIPEKVKRLMNII